MSKKYEAQKARRRFATAERIEKEYARLLSKLVRQIKGLITTSIHSDMNDDELWDSYVKLVTSLRNYSQFIKPWARVVARKMTLRVAKVDANAWTQLGGEMSRELRKEIEASPIGDMLQGILKEQVGLIQSIPEHAADRVHKLTVEAMIDGRRSSELIKDIMQTPDVTMTRARLIARTETSRTATALTMARAKFIGSTHYHWRTCKDGSVRESHKAMSDKVCSWNDPPEVEPGQFYHPGMFNKCRCHASPILDLQNDT